MINFVKVMGVGLVGLITGCSSLGFSHEDKQKHQPEVLADLVSYELQDGYIQITALSRGCTFINSFEVQVNDSKENELKVVRVRPDLCQMKTRRVALQYSYKHLGLDLDENVTVINEVKR